MLSLYLCDTQRLRPLRHEYRKFLARVVSGKPCARVWEIFLQKIQELVQKIGGL